jgi:hypothetical protein
MLGEGNGAEDCVNIYDGDAVLAIDNKTDYVDALHDSGKLVEALLKRSGAAIRVCWELADRIPIKRKGGSVVAPHRIHLPFDYLNHLLAQAFYGFSSRPALRGHSFLQLPAILDRVEIALR